MNNKEKTEVAERTINVHTTRPHEWVLDHVFSEEQCGKRVRTLFWKADKPGSSHFFIEFAHKDSVSMAQRSAVTGVTVHVLARNMNMYPIFDCLARGIDPPRKRTIMDTDVSQSGDNHSLSMSKEQAGSGPSAPKRPRIYEEAVPSRTSPVPPLRDAQEKNLLARPIDSTPQIPRDTSQRGFTSGSSSKPTWPPTDTRRSQNVPSTVHTSIQSQKHPISRYQNNDQNVDGPVSPPRRPLANIKREDTRSQYRDAEFVYSNKYAHRRESDASTRRSSDASSKQPSDGMFKRSPDSYTPNSSLFSAASRQTDVDFSRPIDIKSLCDNDNLGAVIDSLRSSMAGPESWITVAVQYRRKDQSKKALAVTKTMIEVMKERGMQNTDLRPAFLLVAQCQHSIAHKERNDPETLESASSRFVHMLEWLRETYGSNTPVLDAISQAGNQQSLWPVEEDIKPNLSKPLAAPTTGLASSRSQYSQPSVVDKINSSGARIDAVSEENKSLRERLASLQADLSDARHTCLEAESKIRMAETKLTQSQEREHEYETWAIRETDARRRMEERFSEERGKWERRASDMREEGARDAMQELCSILTMTTRSSGSVLGSMRQFWEARGRNDLDGPSSSSVSSAL